MTRVQYASGTSWSSRRVSSASSPAVRLSSSATVFAPAGWSTGSVRSPSRPVQWASSASNPPASVCAASRRAQSRNEVLLTPRAGLARRHARGRRCPGPPRRSRQDTASTTRWCAASNSTGRPPSSGRHEGADPQQRAAGQVEPGTEGTGHLAQHRPLMHLRIRSFAGRGAVLPPPPVPAPLETQPQRVVVLQYGGQGGPQRPSSGSVASSKATVWLKWAGSPPGVSRSQCCTGVSGASPVTGPCSAATAEPAKSGNRSAAAASSARGLVGEQVPGGQGEPGRRAAETIRMPRTESPPSVVVVVGADFGRAEHLGPDRREGLLRLAAGRPAGRAAGRTRPPRYGRRPPVELAGRTERQPLQRNDERGRQMVRAGHGRGRPAALAGSNRAAGPGGVASAETGRSSERGCRRVGGIRRSGRSRRHRADGIRRTGRTGCLGVEGVRQIGRGGRRGRPGHPGFGRVRRADRTRHRGRPGRRVVGGAGRACVRGYRVRDQAASGRPVRVRGPLPPPRPRWRASAASTSPSSMRKPAP